ncbi:MAG: GNAT family N-acetyltransferase, partial [Bacteroidales bacterium]|nr:GNAT family N-acetyltransferase [Bacteroidales bacterium]
MNLKTKRLVLRPVSAHDKAALFAYRRDKTTNCYQGCWIPENEEEAAAFIAKFAKEMNVPGSWFQFVIAEKGQQRIIGDLGIRFPDNDVHQVEVGCTLSKEYHNRGYASEALSRVIDYVFGELQKHRI